MFSNEWPFTRDIIQTIKKARPEIPIIAGGEHVSALPEYQNEYGGGYSQSFNVFNYDPAVDPASWASFDGHKMPLYQADESWGPKLDGTPVRHWDSWVPNTPEFGELRPWTPRPNNIRNYFENALTKFGELFE